MSPIAPYPQFTVLASTKNALPILSAFYLSGVKSVPLWDP